MQKIIKKSEHIGRHGKEKVTVAAIDFIPAWGDLEGNITRFVAAVEKIGQEKIDYAVFPETATCGYLFRDYQEISLF